MQENHYIVVGIKHIVKMQLDLGGVVEGKKEF